jgi:hypothetical protein
VLNESRQANFYLVKAEAICIESPVEHWPPPSNIGAPSRLFTLITGPTEEAREVGETKQEFASRDAIRRHFWETLLDRARAKTKLYTIERRRGYADPFSWATTRLGSHSGRVQ